MALAIAALDPSPFVGDESIAVLDDWAARVMSAGQGAPSIEHLHRVLASELALTGDREEYDSPENSFLPRVLARRRGLPILLSLVWIEVGRRVGLTLFGVGLPGHFIVGHSPRAGDLVLFDAFDGGARLGPSQLVALVARAGEVFHMGLLVPATPRAIAVRMLRNLASAYGRRGRVSEAMSAAQLWLAASPDDAEAIRLFEELDSQARTVWS